MKKPETIAEKILYLFLLYTIWTWAGVLFCALRILGTVRISHWERFPHRQGNLLVISNHPSLLEPILLPMMFFWDYFLNPFKLCPYSAPDKKNYWDRWYWFLIKLRMIPIDRKDRRRGIRAFLEMKRVLNSGGILILFPEGGRTCFGTEFLYSQKGNRIRILEKGIGLLISKTNPLVLPIWVDGAENVLPNSPDRNKLYWTFPRIWKQMTIKIGRVRCFRKGLGPEKIVQEVAVILLNLADNEE